MKWLHIALALMFALATPLVAAHGDDGVHLEVTFTDRDVADRVLDDYDDRVQREDWDSETSTALINVRASAASELEGALLAETGVVSITRTSSHSLDVRSETRTVDSDGNELRERTRVVDGELRTETRARTADGDEVRTRTLVSDDGEVRERLRARTADGAELRERLRSLRSGEVREELRVRMTAEQRDRLAKMSPAAIAALEESGQLERVMDRLRTSRASEVRFERRSVDDEVRMRAEARFEQAKRGYEREKIEYRERSEAFAEARTRLRVCESADGAEACQEIRAEVHSEAKASLTGAIDALIKHMEQLKARAEADESLSEEQSAAITVHADAVIGQANALRVRAEASEDGQQVRAVAQDLGQLIMTARSSAERVAAHQEGERTLSTLRRAERFDAQVSCSLEGVDAAVDLSSYEQAVFEARVLIEEAQALHEQGDYVQARALVREARDALRDARSEARLVIEQLRAEGVALADCEVTVSEESFSDDDLSVELEVDEMLVETELEVEIKVGSDSTSVSLQKDDWVDEYTLETTDVEEVLRDVAERLNIAVEDVRAAAEIESEVDSGGSGTGVSAGSGVSAESDDALTVEVESDIEVIV